MNSRNAVKPYRSPLRDAQAQTTRRKVIDAATRLFSERGYAATSVDHVAEAAGVSRATVFNAVGNKPVLLKTALDLAIVGDDDAIPLPDRPRSRAIRAEPDPRKYLSLYAELVTDVAARLAPITDAARSAAGADPDARRLWQEHQAQRLVGAQHVVADLVSKGGLRRGLAKGEAADLVWVLNDSGLYYHLVLLRGWTPARFSDWLAATLQEQLLG